MEFPEVSWLNLPTGPLAYRRAGTGSPLLLIHGWGGSSRYWMGAFATLAEQHDLIALDMPGFGESPPPKTPATLDTLTASALATIDALGLGRVTVVGHSLGAAIALLLAAARPDRVERTILASFGLPRSSVEAGLFAGLHTQLRTNAALWSPWLNFWGPWFTMMRPWTQMAWMTPPWPILLASQVVYRMNEIPYAAMAIGVADLVAMDPRVAMEAASSSGDPIVIVAAEQVRVPTLVVSGREDPLFPPTAVIALANTLPDAGLVLLDNCGHVPMIEAAVPFYTSIGAFLA
ncbi:MAG: alpha/beta hydrolase [Chloroflexia bacterium]|nr:alpha/beta hydrolase [Chloroflexia bacterium]